MIKKIFIIWQNWTSSTCARESFSDRYRSRKGSPTGTVHLSHLNTDVQGLAKASLSHLTGRRLNFAGFTLVELIISVAIFALMTALLVAKYGTFNQGILLTNLAYDVALTLRTAQSYGLNVKSKPIYGGDNYSDKFNYPYGVLFNTDSGIDARIIFFADANGPDSNGVYGDGVYNGASEDISTYNIKRGSRVSSICITSIGNPTCNPVAKLWVIFKRPDPDAIINGDKNNTSAEITLLSSDGGTKKVIIRKTGQIAVSN